MNELKLYWYSKIKLRPNKEFFNYCVSTESLCTNAIASALDVDFEEEEKIALSCLAFEILEEEIGSLLFNLRRASYPSQDQFDSDQLFDLEQMIKVATYFEISFIKEILEKAKELHIN